MRKGLCLGLCLSLVLLLCACAGINFESGSASLPTESVIEDTTSAATIEVPEITTGETETTAPAHSALYLPEYTSQQVWEYFEEVVLRAEYSDGTGNTALVQKWKEPIIYSIYGTPTEEDLSV